MGIELEIYICTVVTLIGLCAGSFVNVCINRIPAGESIITPPSRCPDCGKRLKWYEFIPLFSYIALRGRCKGCKAKISMQYPIVEAANALLWLLIMLIYGLSDISRTIDLAAAPGITLFEITAIPARVFIGCLLASALLTAAVIDIKTMEIPPGINIAILVLAILNLALDYRHWHIYAIGAVAVSGVLLILWIVTGGRAIGGGDIKLMAVCGLYLGWQLIIAAFLLGCIAGSVIHLTRMAISNIKKDGKAGRVLAFGPYLALGVYASMLFGAPLVAWYIGLYS